ncbi:MAG: hypothetical protein H5U40_08815 [Polyangiaceae bacterium]|nr:hypothetical protein [Polyangiaceae bacterium]
MQALSLGAALSACGGEGTGDVRILIEAEDTIVSGLLAGTGDEDIQDGWAVVFDTYLVAIGNVELGRRADAGAVIATEEARIFDLAAVSSGDQLSFLEAVPSGRWDLFSYETPRAAAATPCEASVEADDCAAMRDGGLTYLIRGTLSKSGGQSCPPGKECRPADAIAFELAVVAPTRYEGCQDNEVAGVAIPEGGETSAKLTLHGDHLFFDSFPGVGEGVVVRRAQWLANADVNEDGRVDMVELQSIDDGDFPALFPDFATHSFTGSPLTIETAADYARAQLSTQGHLNGEGECLPVAL